MATIRIEFVTLGESRSINGAALGTILSFHGAVELNITATATSGGARPVVPAFGDRSSGHMLIRALDGKSVVAWGGGDPVATSTNGKRIEAGDPEVPVFVRTGDLISGIEVT